MSLSRWLRPLASALAPTHRTRRHGRRTPANRSHAVEVLEDRCLLSATLLRDLNTDTLGSSPTGLVRAGDTLFFRVADAGHGSELWRSDGTGEGTLLVKDINPGQASSTPTDLTDVNGTLFFLADDGTHGLELWKSDGTGAGTSLVKDIVPGNDSPFLADFGGVQTRQGGLLVGAGDTLYFTAVDPDHGLELWRSDGTEAGTYLLKDINPGRTRSDVRDATVIGDTLFFTAEDGTHGRELWKSDGTEAGTVLVKDINPGQASADVRGLTNVGGTLFFAANDRLWKSDGTEAGTLQVTTGAPSPRNLTDVGGTLFFTAYLTRNSPELWKSDGTEAGTVLVKDINPGTASSAPHDLRNLNGTLFFVANDGSHGDELWESDGTEAGTVLVKDVAPGTASGLLTTTLTAGDGVLYFAADDQVHGKELWKTDGTEAGTVLVADVAPGAASGISDGGFFPAPPELVAVNGTLFFAPQSPRFGKELWKTDGTEAGTVLVADINRDSGSADPHNLTSAGAALYFAADDRVHGTELWRSDGTPQGTALVKDIVPGEGGANPFELTAVGDVLYFDARTRANVTGLWKTDGTDAGTTLLREFDGRQSLGPIFLTPVGGSLFFIAKDLVADTGYELWKTDGTPDGTVMVKDINPGAADSFPRGLTAVGDTLYFVADDGVHGRELWKSDGTADGTALVKDINPGAVGAFDAYFAALRAVGNTVYFAADDGAHGFELWRTDGTADGTALVKDINPGEAGSLSSSYDPGLTAVGGTAFFVADDGGHGRELWKTDGTGAGTTLVKDVVAGSDFSDPRELTAVGDTLFFAAGSGGSFGTGDVELWKSDGTEAGTVLVKDIWPGPASSIPTSLTAVGGALYFSAQNDLFGRELWVSDGTPDGTVAVQDLAPGEAGGLNPFFGLNSVAAAGGSLYFVADNGHTGSEVWRLPLGGQPVARDDAYSVDEDGTLAVAPGGVLANDGDGSGAPLTGTPVLAPSHGTLALEADGSFVYTPNPLFHGTDRFAYAANDGSADGNVAVVTVTVHHVNHAPRAADDQYRVTPGFERQVGSFAGLLANDTDVDGDPLKAVLVDGPTHGTLTLRDDGSFTYTGGDDFGGSDRFTYLVTDGQADSEAATVTLTRNTRPVAVADEYSLLQYKTLEVVAADGLLANDTDADGDRLRPAVTAEPSHGFVDVNADGSFTYFPNNDFSGTDAFTYTASDGVVASEPVVVTVHVIPRPKAVDDGTYRILRGTTLTVSAPGVLANDVSPHGRPLVATLEADYAPGKLVLNPDGSFTYTPLPDEVGPTFFTYKVSDGVYESQFGAAVSILVVPPPTSHDDLYGEVLTGSTLDVPAAQGVLANDADGQSSPLTAALVDGPSHGTLTLRADGSFTYVPGADYAGRDGFTYRANNGLADGNLATVTIIDSVLVSLDEGRDFYGERILTVQSYGDPSSPVFGFFDTGASMTSSAFYDRGDTPVRLAGGAVAGAVGGTITGDVGQSAPLVVDGLHAGIGTGPDGLPAVQFHLDKNSLVTAPLQSFLGTEGGSPLLPTIAGTPILRPSAVHPDGLAALVDMRGVVLDFRAEFPDSTPLAFPDLTFVAPGIRLTAGDGTKAPVRIPLTLVGGDNIDNPGHGVSQAPLPMQTGVRVGHGSASVSGQHFLFDTGAEATVLSRSAALALGLDLDHPDFSFPVDGIGGVVEDVPYFLLDQLEVPTAEGRTLLFRHVPTVVLDLPEGTDGYLGMNLFNTASKLLYDPYDPAGASLSVTFLDNPVRESPGTTVIPIKIWKALGGPFVAAVQGRGVPGVNLTEVNTAPVSLGDSYEINEDAPLTVAGAGVLANDSDAEADPLAATLVSGPAHGALALNADGTFRYTPDADYNGTDSFTYTAGDGTAAGAPMTVTFRVTPVNDAPTAADDAARGVQDGEVRGRVLGNDADVDHDTLSAMVGTPPAHGTLTLNADGSFVYTPDASFAGSDRFTYRADDGHAASAEAAVALTVAPRDDVFLTHLYQDLLGRAPEEEGFHYWRGLLDAGVSRERVSAGIAASPEYRTDQVQQLYTKYLGRSADANELKAALAATDGLPDGTNGLKATLLSSAGYVARAGSGVDFVRSLFRDVLGRVPDPGGEAWWAGRLADGASASQVALGVLTSEEARLQAVDGFYQSYLRRGADEGGRAYFAALLGRGVAPHDLIGAMLGTPEYFRRDE